MRPTTTLLTTLLLATSAPFLLLLAAPVPAPAAVAVAVAVPEPNDVLVPKGATLHARSIPELLALKRANERRRLGGKEMEMEMDGARGV